MLNIHSLWLCRESNPIGYLIRVARLPNHTTLYLRYKVYVSFYGLFIFYIQ